MDRKGKAKDKPETKQGASRKRGGGNELPSQVDFQSYVMTDLGNQKQHI